MGTGKLKVGGNPVMDPHPIQGGRGGSVNSPSNFMLQKPEISAGQAQAPFIPIQCRESYG